MEVEPNRIQSLDQPGVKASGDVLRTMRQEVAQLLGRHQVNFPGAQPVSFARKHLDELHHVDYFVCEKSDGIRYLLYITDDDEGSEAIYLIDRKNDYWFITNRSLHFPTPQSEQSFHKGTILDGELVMDDIGNGKHEPRFLVFDCLAADGHSFVTRPLTKRLGRLDLEIFQPYRQLLKKYPEERQYQPFFIEMKAMQASYNNPAIFEDVIKKLRHGNDGLIFTGVHSEYRHGTDHHILKWKDAEENTVDFKWKFTFPTITPNEELRARGHAEPFVDWTAVPSVEILVYHGDSGSSPYQHFGTLHLESQEWDVLKGLNEPLDERIIEAYMDSQKRWRFYRFRDDKHHGNHVSVVNSVIESIKDGVTKEELINASASIRRNWKAREGKN